MGRHVGDRGRSPGFRTTQATWEAYLGHLATLSPVEISKLPGMPSSAAFRKKRLRDADFDHRATETMSGRRLSNSGRKRITEAAWDRFLILLPTAGVAALATKEGIPSESAVYQRRSRDPAFRARLDAIIHDLRRERQRRIESRLRLIALRRNPAFNRRMLAAIATRAAMRRKARQDRLAEARRDRVRPLGERLNAELLRNELYAAAAAVVPSTLNAETRGDIIGDLVLAVLEGEVSLLDLPKAAKEVTRRHWRLFGTYGALSLDAPIAPRSKVTIGDRIAAAAA